MRIGETIDGRFELREVLGEGGMGQVFRAWDTGLERYVAIKAMLPQFMSDPAAFEEMKQEVRLSQRLSHPSIVAVYDYRVHERTPFIIMEYIDGVPLHHYLFRTPARRLDERTFLALADQILVGVAYAHDRGVVHRDLKPANIMVLGNGLVKLMDFGIAAAIKATYTKVTGRSSGLTIQYSSPEQINGENPSPSMDIYSLGCVFYEMLAGHPPFYQGEVLHQQLTRQPTPLVGVSAAINAAVLGCLVKDPTKRLRSAGEVRLALAGGRTIRLPRAALAGIAPTDGRAIALPDAPTVPSLTSWQDVDATGGPLLRLQSPGWRGLWAAWQRNALAPALIAGGVVLVGFGSVFLRLQPAATGDTAPAAATVSAVPPSSASNASEGAKDAPPPDGSESAAPQPEVRPQKSEPAHDPVRSREVDAPVEETQRRAIREDRVPSLEDSEGYDYLSMRDAASRGAADLTLNAFLLGQTKVLDDRVRRERWKALGAQAAQQLVRSVRRNTTDPNKIAYACEIAGQMDARVVSRECRGLR